MAEIAALKAIRQLFVVEAEQVENRRARMVHLAARTLSPDSFTLPLQPQIGRFSGTSPMQFSNCNGCLLFKVAKIVLVSLCCFTPNSVLPSDGSLGEVSVPANSPATVPIITVQPTNLTVPAGVNTNFAVAASASPAPAFQWFFNTASIPQATNARLYLANIHSIDAGSYSVVVSNSAGVITSALATLTVIPAPTTPGLPNIDFYPGPSPSPSSGPWQVGFHLDGVLVAQPFARFRGDGSVDSGFHVSTPGGSIATFATDPQGNIIVGGWFTSVAGLNRNGLARLNPDGTPDPTFASGTGPNGTVTRIRLLSDGRVMIGGEFTAVDGYWRAGMARLLSNGFLDRTFSPVSGAGRLLDVQSDGKVITMLSNRFVRLQQDGSVDSTFTTPALAWCLTNAVALSDGRIIVSGACNAPFGGISRLMPDGSPDSSFKVTALTNGNIATVTMQSDGRIVIGGTFTNFDGVSANRLIRLLPDGDPDPEFTVGSGVKGGFTPAVNCIAVREDGALLIGGSFTRVNDYYRTNVAMIHGGPLANPTINVQPSNLVVTAGMPARVFVGAWGLPSPTFQWQRSGINLPGATSPTLVLNGTRLVDAGDYRVLVSNALGVATSVVATVTVQPQAVHSGDADGSFNPGEGPDGRVLAVVAQPDGRILMGGEFTAVDLTLRGGIARLLPDGQLDQAFDSGFGIWGWPGAAVNSIAVQPDGAVVIGGIFTNFNHHPRQCVARLLSDGSVDKDFNPQLGAWPVRKVAVQTDGKILVAGDFSVTNGQVWRNLVRLHSNGSVDTNFSPGSAGSVLCLSLAPDGSIYLGGNNNLYDYAYKYAARVHPSGTIDSSFRIRESLYPVSECGIVAPPLAEVRAIAALPDGRVLAAGCFSSFTGGSNSYLIRLNDDGAIDHGYLNGTAPNDVVMAMASQPDGAVVIGGCFSVLGSNPRDGIARIRPDGTLDAEFHPEVIRASFNRPGVMALAIDVAGRVLVGGDFTSAGGLPRRNLVRLQAGLQLFRPAFDATSFSAYVTTVEGHTYILEYKESPTDQAWITASRRSGSGEVVQLADPGPLASQRFYRVRVE